MALADELAGAADLVKGKLDGRPVAVVRGLSGLVGDPGGTAAELVRPAAEDLFPLGSREAVLAAALIAAGRADAYEELVRLDAAERAAAVLRLVGVEGPAAELLRGCCLPIFRIRPRSVHRDRLGRAFALTVLEESTGVPPRPNPPSTRSAGKGGKPAAATKTAPAQSRRDKLASFEAARKKDARNRTIRLLVICLVLATALLAYPVYLFVDDYRARNADLATLGVDAGGGRLRPGHGGSGHGQPGPCRDRDQGDLPGVPAGLRPALPEPAAFDRKFYTMQRPPTGRAARAQPRARLHHRLVPRRRTRQDIRALERIGKTFSGEDYNPEDKFIAAPWAESDGGAFPDGKNVVLTRWTADPNDPADTTKQFGVRQSCTSVSGQAIKDFMAKYPVANSPEPNGALTLRCAAGRVSACCMVN